MVFLPEVKGCASTFVCSLFFQRAQYSAVPYAGLTIPFVSFLLPRLCRKKKGGYPDSFEPPTRRDDDSIRALFAVGSDGLAVVLPRPGLRPTQEQAREGLSAELWDDVEPFDVRDFLVGQRWKIKTEGKFEQCNGLAVAFGEEHGCGIGAISHCQHGVRRLLRRGSCHGEEGRDFRGMVVGAIGPKRAA
jgi:hypothetical protein